MERRVYLVKYENCNSFISLTLTIEMVDLVGAVNSLMIGMTVSVTVAVEKSLEASPLLSHSKSSNLNFKTRKHILLKQKSNDVLPIFAFYGCFIDKMRISFTAVVQTSFDYVWTIIKYNIIPTFIVR